MERIWIYQADRLLTENEQRKVIQLLDGFTSQWKVHGRPLAASGELRYGLFVILKVDESQASASGCSIDSSVRFITEMGRELNIDFFDRMRIAYRDESGLQVVPRADFEQALAEGIVTRDTIVFNNLISTNEELATSWEIPFERSWHPRLFQLA